MSPILSGLLIFMALYMIIDIFVKQNSFGLWASEIKNTLFGNENEFLDPISKASFLEFIHTEIFFIMMILLTLSTVFIRLSNKLPYSLVLVNLTMLTALSSLFSLGIAYFYSPSFINIYVTTYLIWHITSFYMIIYSLWKLNFAKSI